MKIFYKMIKCLFIFSAILVLVNYAKPYWNRYLLEKQLETVAIYGTKHGLYETKSFLMEKMKAEGYTFKEDDFIIKKDENNHVSIDFAYNDEIKIFGKLLKKLQLNGGVSAKEVKSYF